MYTPLPNTPTRSQYRILLNETISIFDELSKKTSLPLFKQILQELKDIKAFVVDIPIFDDWEKINDRFSIGAIATKNFEEGNELRDRLCDVFGGAIEYAEMKEL
jgi:hypothetical protein